MSKKNRTPQPETEQPTSTDAIADAFVAGMAAKAKTRKPKAQRKAKLTEPQTRALDLLRTGGTLTWVFPGPCRIGDTKIDAMVARALEARRLITQATDGTWTLTGAAQIAA